MDTGNYDQSNLPRLAHLMMAAREMGDEDVLNAARSAIERDHAPVEREVAHDAKGAAAHGSPFAGPALQASLQVFGMGIAMGLFGCTDGFFDMVAKGRTREWVEGPYIATVPYPHVLVARAVTDGTCLDAVFQPGTDGGTFKIALAQLQPGRHYAVTGALSETVTAGTDGSAVVSIDLHGRVELSVVPES